MGQETKITDLEMSSLELEVSRVLEKVTDGSVWLAVVLSSELAMPLCSSMRESPPPKFEVAASARPQQTEIKSRSWNAIWTNHT